MEEVNSDGKANLDILSAVKYGKELLNEQLIPGRYHVPARTWEMMMGQVKENRGEKGAKELFNFLNATKASETNKCLHTRNASGRISFASSS